MKQIYNNWHFTPTIYTHLCVLTFSIQSYQSLCTCSLWGEVHNNVKGKHGCYVNSFHLICLQRALKNKYSIIKTRIWKISMIQRRSASYTTCSLYTRQYGIYKQVTCDFINDKKVFLKFWRVLFRIQEYMKARFFVVAQSTANMSHWVKWSVKIALKSGFSKMS